MTREEAVTLILDKAVQRMRDNWALDAYEIGHAVIADGLDRLAGACVDDPENGSATDAIREHYEMVIEMINQRMAEIGGANDNGKAG